MFACDALSGRLIDGVWCLVWHVKMPISLVSRHFAVCDAANDQPVGSIFAEPGETRVPRAVDSLYGGFESRGQDCFMRRFGEA